MRSQRLIKVLLRAEETSTCALLLPFSLLCAISMVCCVLALDFQMLFAYRLSRLAAPLHLRWAHLTSQFDADNATKWFGCRIRDALPQVLTFIPGPPSKSHRRASPCIRPSRPFPKRPSTASAFLEAREPTKHASERCLAEGRQRSRPCNPHGRFRSLPRQST